MLPALPSRTTEALDELVLAVPSASSALGRGLHPLIADEIARLMLKVNSYYTNAMEGNPSKLKDIDAALAKQLSRDKTARDFQLEHLAHLAVQEEMLTRLRDETDLKVCSADFLCWLHERFFHLLPDDLRWAKTVRGDRVRVEPGHLREHGVTVGRHEAPETREQIAGHLDRFAELLGPERLAGPQKILGWAASHHRFLWIHPFPEGNGRVARLLTTAYASKIGIEEGRLWTVARAFARRRAEYDDLLAAADLPRRNDLDGRGPLSEESLVDFCRFFLACCLDQIRFMDARLQLGQLQPRYHRFVEGLVSQDQVSRSGAKVLTQLLLQGEVPRGQVTSLAGVKQRRATQVVKELLETRVVHSPSAYGPLRLNITGEMAAVLFPELA